MMLKMKLIKEAYREQKGVFYLVLFIFVVSLLFVVFIVSMSAFIRDEKNVPYKVELKQEILPGWSVDDVSGLFRELIFIHNETGAWTSVTYSDIDSTMTIWVKVRGLSTYKVEKITHELADLDFKKLQMVYVVNEVW